LFTTKSDIVSLLFFKMAPKTSAEKSRLFRERLKSDPIKYAEFLRKDRERYEKKKQQGLIKSVKEMSVSDQKKIRRQWQTVQRHRRGETCHILTEIIILIFYENMRMIVFMILFLFQIICYTWNELCFLLSAVRPVVHQYTIPV
jgi:hypothetical protein